MTSPLPPFTHPRLLLAFHFGISFGTAYTREISPKVASPSDKSRPTACPGCVRMFSSNGMKAGTRFAHTSRSIKRPPTRYSGSA
ncbi:hypothetical protein PF002_g11926 [Phytophthora fragariae]|uniref:Secreted protein n=1 Tax=Phytophthora fragariae TaxID=53985 RepID=A0A6A3ZBP9_9STRA|nr:hypothetical protein PF002_g11926 [Phytophthora fragariae]